MAGDSFPPDGFPKWEKVNNWRPKDWKNPYTDRQLFGKLTDQLRVTFEAGADAILETLEKMRVEDKRGWCYFIPDVDSQ